MKMFKKLMAVALAGVMALTLLAGCANKIVPVSEKEVLALITDSNPITYGKEKVTLKGADETAAVKALKVIQDYKEANKDAEIVNDSGYINHTSFMGYATELQKELNVTDETKELVLLSCTKVEDYQSQSMQEMHNYELFRRLTGSGLQVNSAHKVLKSGEGTISLKIGKIGDENYIVAVTYLPTEE